MDENTDIGPFLKQVKRDVPFTVPEGYFGQFQDKLDQAIRADRKVPARRTLRPYLAAASIIAAMLLAGTLVFRHQYRQQVENRFHAEVSRTVDMELYSISEDIILESMEPATSADDQSVTGSEGEMIDYLLQDINEEDLLNSL